MVELLAKIFLKDTSDVKNAKVRQGYGRISCILGIVLNVILFAGKYLAGALSKSVAIMADSFNNLSDAGSSLITLLGFQMAGKKADLEHPFGHGRVEYLSGLAVSSMILIMGVELFRTSVQKILHPEPVDTSLISFVILIAAIVVKLYMSSYNKKIGEKINSAAMKATAADSLSDAVATTVVLISMFITKFTGWNVDGICGLFVAIFILRAGYEAAKETLSPLLGKAPEAEFVEEIEHIVMSHENVTGMHDLIVHDYGPGRCMISLHAEVPGDGDVFELHDMIDTIERELKEKLECEAVIHMDPIHVNDEEVEIMKRKVLEKIKEKDERLSIHDFRMVKGPTHTNVIFDIVLPADYKMGEEEVKKWIDELMQKNFENVYAVVTVDHAYV
ncbi:MAG: cation diffusion facilitator family transporter [Clostridiales bacterium]|nr:cation diffusion facilitator family transporter [Clostridiales bacterium]